MSQTTAPKVAPTRHASKYWEVARVARRLRLRYTAPIAGRLVAAHLDRLRGSYHPEWAFWWVYWLAVLTEIERHCGYRFPVPDAGAA